MLWRRLLIVVAGVAALALAVCFTMKSGITQAMKEDLSSMPFGAPFGKLGAQYSDIAESCYPYVWQKAQRERLRELLTWPTTPPSGTDELSLARYARYAENHTEDENVLREGMRRDPQNAYYHYLLAYLYIKGAIDGPGPVRPSKNHTQVSSRSKRQKRHTGTISPTDELTFELPRALHHPAQEPEIRPTDISGRVLSPKEAERTFHYEYQVTDRRLLDRGMQELATGLRLPFHSRRGTIVQAQLTAMPPARSFDTRISEISVMANILFPEYAKARIFARVNGYYLSLLLREGKRTEAEPFLHTGERLSVQLANDTPPTLIAQLVALAVSELCRQNDTAVCCTLGYPREAEAIESRHAILMGKVRQWEKIGRLEHRKQHEQLLKDHAGILPGILFPVFGTQPEGLITEDTLRPSRLVEYVVAEEWVTALLAMLLFMLLVCAGLKYWRWKIITRGAGVAEPGIDLSTGDWARVIGIGFLLPLTLYLLYIATPTLSLRDHGLAFTTEHGIHLAAVHFIGGLGICVLWMLIVPTTMTAGILWRRSLDAGMLMVESPWRARFTRLGVALLSLIWAGLGIGTILVPVSWGLVSIVSSSRFRDPMQVVLIMLFGLVLLGIPLLPVLWERGHVEHAAYHLAMARTMIAVYAVLTVLVAVLPFVCAAYEREYIRTDKLMGLAGQGDEIEFTSVELQVVKMLRADVREGATKLQIPW